MADLAVNVPEHISPTKGSSSSPDNINEEMTKISSKFDDMTKRIAELEEQTRNLQKEKTALFDDTTKRIAELEEQTRNLQKDKTALSEENAALSEKYEKKIQSMESECEKRSNACEQAESTRENNDSKDNEWQTMTKKRMLISSFLGKTACIQLESFESSSSRCRITWLIDV